MALTYLLAFILAAPIAAIGTWRIRRWALARGWSVGPRSARDVHAEPVPRLGGVAIFLATGLTLALLQLISRLFHLPLVLDRHLILGIGIPASLIFLVGLLDDFRPVGPYVKLAVQTAAGLLLYGAGFRVVHVTFWSGQLNQAVALGATILWVLWITNAFNLLDGLDGLATGSALFTTLVVFIVSLLTANPLVGVVALALAGSSLGFLPFNFNPASIFLGDCGSLFIGFTLSALSIAGAAKSPTLVALAIPIVASGLPILDTVLSVARRFLSGKPLFGADREHIHHKLLKRGWTQRQAVVALYGVSAGFALTSLFLLFPASGGVGVALVVVGLFVFLGVQQLGYHEFSEIHRMARRTVNQKQVIIHNLAIRRAAEALATSRDFAEICRTLATAFESHEFDGFFLEYQAQPGRAPLIYEWERPDSSSGTAWTLRLSLETPAGGEGSLTLRRGYRAEPLLFDVTTLLTGFHGALTEALSRAALKKIPPASVEIARVFVDQERATAGTL